MKTMGVNAIRTSHNPPAPALLDFADRMGFVVMDEAFDEWKQNKTRFGYGQFFDEWSERDMRDFVRRDRNHAERHHVEHRQRDSRAGQRAGRRGDGGAARGVRDARKIRRGR